jgi:arylsulfatase
MADQMWLFVPAQQVIGKFLATFKEFPQRQPIGSLSVEKVLKQMEAGSPVGQ